MRLTAAAALAAALLASSCQGGSPDPEPTQAPLDGVVVTKGLTHDHVLGHVDYPVHPPVGGPHRPPKVDGLYGWQACAVYDQPVVDEFAVHSLEHGAVWVTYQPSLPVAGVQELRALAGIRPEYVLVSPYEGQASPVTVTAWGLQLAVTDPADPRVADFVRQYAGGGQGGEPGSDCAHGATLEQARAALP